MPISPEGKFETEEKKLERENAERTRKIELISNQVKGTKVLLELMEEELKKTSTTTKRYKELVDQINELNKLHEKQVNNAIKIIDNIDNQYTALEKLTQQYRRFSDVLAHTGEHIGKNLQAYHTYNLELQKLADSTAKFYGASQKGLQFFDRMRRELNLTREEVRALGSSMATGLRLGIDENQLRKTIGHLRELRGREGGNASFQQIIGASVSRTTLRGAVGGNAQDLAMAISVASEDQVEAIADLGRRLTNRPEDARQALRFEKQTAYLSHLQDNIKLGMQAGLATGIGPQYGALLVPLDEMNKNIAELVKISGGFSQYLNAAVMGASHNLLEGLVPHLKMANVKATLKAGGAAAAIPAAAAVMAGVWSKVFDLMASKQEKGSGIERVLSGAGTVSRLGGYTAGGAAAGAAAGAMFGGPVGAGGGALAGAAYGASQEFGPALMEFGNTVAAQVGQAIARSQDKMKSPTTKYGEITYFDFFIKELDGWGSTFGGAVNKFGAFTTRMVSTVTGVEPKNLETDFGAELLDWAKTSSDVRTRLSKVGDEIGSLPNVIAAQIAKSQLPLALQSIKPDRMREFIEASTVGMDEAMTYAGKRFQEELDIVGKQLQERLARKGLSDQERKALEGRYQTTRQGIAQEMIKTAETGGGKEAADAAMQRVQTQAQQRSQETQTIRNRFLMAGVAGTEYSNRLQEQINREYELNVQTINEGNVNQEKALRSTQNNLRVAMKGVRDPEVRRYLQAQIDQYEEEIRTRQRILTENKSSEQLKRQNAIVELAQLDATEYERDILLRRSQRQLQLSKARESFLRESGATPGEIGGAAAQQAASADMMLNRFMTTFGKNMTDLRAKMEQMRAAGNTMGALQIEQEIYNLADKRLELERQMVEAHLHRATAEEKYRQDQIGAYRRIAEINRDMSARVGMSWRVQMGYQGEIIKASQKDLESTRRELTQMASELKSMGKDPMQNIQFLNKMGDLAQKQASLAEAIIGKQRSFLEQATAAGFGVGGGTKVLPTINPRMFGEMTQGFTGLRQPGAPMTMRENRAMLRGNLGPQIFGNIPGGVTGPGGGPGVGGGMAPLGTPVAPGAAPGAVPGAAGPPTPGTVMNPGRDISGDIRVAVELKSELLVATIHKVITDRGKPGSMS